MASRRVVNHPTGRRLQETFDLVTLVIDAPRETLAVQYLSQGLILPHAVAVPVATRGKGGE